MTASDPVAPEDPILVRVEDLRAARLCLQGARPWFRRHGFDWQDFLISGISADRLATTGDALALRVIATARERVGREDRDSPPNPHTEDRTDGR